MQLEADDAFFALTRVDGSGKMVRKGRHGRHDEAYVCEPGDGTHYEIMLQDRLAMGVVGEANDSAASGILYVTRWPSSFVRKLGDPSDYTVSVLTYLIDKALGHDVPEPEGLTRYRRERTVAN